MMLLPDHLLPDGHQKHLCKTRVLFSIKRRVQPGFLGSEAGAVGQCQFMPSNYFQFALKVDHARDGTPDIWNSPQDTLASIANFLRAHGYRKGDSYGTLAVLANEEDLAEVCETMHHHGRCLSGFLVTCLKTSDGEMAELGTVWRQ